MSTARQIIASELINWIEKQDYTRLSNNQRLEEVTQIWEFGKWAAKGAKHKLGYTPQSDYSEGWPESTAWDAIIDISDDEGMRIHAATVGLSKYEFEILNRVYIQWQPVNLAIQQMKTGRDTFFNARRAALEHIERFLCEAV